jgi:aspartyl-tRNA(Asn)/glutamyl-tRNA(Gln) amidotransferase subunit B
MFAPSANVAHEDFDGVAPNTLLDPVVLGLPGALPVMNRAAVEASIRVGLALGCAIAERSVWDRKSYFYPDMPKAYQISQYQLPLCGAGSVELPAFSAGGKIDVEQVMGAGSGGQTGKRIGITRAHLEEDAGKLLHEAPGGGAIEWSIVDLNRSGTPLLEIVTEPDFSSADEVVVFCQFLRGVCRFLGVTEGVMQKGHMRFEPNINCVLTLADGRTVRTPIVEVKNLNSFKAVRGAIEYEFREQPGRWLSDGRVIGAGAKSTRGWDDERGVTVLQREKEDAHDYRYFPDPDLPAVVVDRAWLDRLAASVPELPLPRARRMVQEFSLPAKEALALTEERGVCRLFDDAVEASVREHGLERGRVGRLVANVLLQSGAKRANARSTADEVVLISALGVNARQIAAIVQLRERGKISAQSADALFGMLCTRVQIESDEPLAGAEHGAAAEAIEGIAKARGMLIESDPGKLDAWCEQAIRENAQSAADVRAGKMQAIGRLVGAVVKLAGGQVDAASARARLTEMLGA